MCTSEGSDALDKQQRLLSNWVVLDAQNEGDVAHRFTSGGLSGHLLLAAFVSQDSCGFGRFADQFLE
jgi:hypothetical protein